jgi:hypothetical protein
MAAAQRLHPRSRKPWKAARCVWTIPLRRVLSAPLPVPPSALAAAIRTIGLRADIYPKGGALDRQHAGKNVFVLI